MTVPITTTVRRGEQTSFPVTDGCSVGLDPPLSRRMGSSAADDGPGAGDEDDIREPCVGVGVGRRDGGAGSCGQDSGWDGPLSAGVATSRWPQLTLTDREAFQALQRTGRTESVSHALSHGRFGVGVGDRARCRLEDPELVEVEEAPGAGEAVACCAQRVVDLCRGDRVVGLGFGVLGLVAASPEAVQGGRSGHCGELAPSFRLRRPAR
jgi:hypothetical protein